VPGVAGGAAAVSDSALTAFGVGAGCEPGDACAATNFCGGAAAIGTVLPGSFCRDGAEGSEAFNDCSTAANAGPCGPAGALAGADTRSGETVTEMAVVDGTRTKPWRCAA
jgi:hypothetical protein